MDPDLRKELRLAREALAEGSTLEGVNLLLAERTDQMFQSVEALEAYLQNPNASHPNELRAASDPRAGSSLSPIAGGVADFARMGVQALSGGFADEVAGDRDYVQAIRRDPVAAMAGEVAGAAIPMAPILNRGGVMGGALAGGVGGALTAAGERDGTLLERLAAMPTGAGIGAAAGALIPGAAAIMARRGAPRRVASELERTTGVKRTDRAARREEAREMKKGARAAYQGVSEQYPRVIDDDLTALLEDLYTNSGPDARAAVRRIEDRSAPTVEELQRARTSLRKKRRMDDADALTTMMNRVPGFEAADDLYYTANSARRALDQGKKMVNANADDIAEALAALPPDQQFMFRQGQVTELLERINKTETRSVAALKNILDAGPAYRDTLRTMFPTESAFEDFMRVIARERRVDVVAAQARRWLPWLTVGGAVTAAANN